MRRLLPAMLLAVALTAGACANEGGGAEDRIEVVAAFHPLAELAQRIGGDRVAVTDLTPSGSEPHDLELSPRDVDRIVDADVVIHAGAAFQPAVADAAGRSEGRAVDITEEIDMGSDDDPHFWLDPVLHREAAEVVLNALVAADGSGSAAFTERAADLDSALADVHAGLESGLRSCERRTIVTAHEAFGRMAERYDLEQQAITGLSPEAEPDPKRLAELADLVQRQGVTTIFTEELVSPEVADALAREAGVNTAVLDTIEGRADDGAPYEDRMGENLSTLRAALGCT